MSAIEVTYKLAMAAGHDAGNRNMRRAGRTQWNEEDWRIAVKTANCLLGTSPDALLSALGGRERD